tara:strand:- start:5001 stop:5336 length:336 start_codon:yes stop_codon:yes gene_type:complete
LPGADSPSEPNGFPFDTTGQTSVCAPQVSSVSFTVPAAGSSISVSVVSAYQSEQAYFHKKPHERQQTEIDREGTTEKRRRNPIPDAAEDQRDSINEAHCRNEKRGKITENE